MIDWCTDLNINRIKPYFTKGFQIQSEPPLAPMIIEVHIRIWLEEKRQYNISRNKLMWRHHVNVHKKGRKILFWIADICFLLI